MYYSVAEFHVQSSRSKRHLRIIIMLIVLSEQSGKINKEGFAQVVRMINARVWKRVLESEASHHPISTQ